MPSPQAQPARRHPTVLRSRATRADVLRVVLVGLSTARSTPTRAGIVREDVQQGLSEDRTQRVAHALDPADKGSDMLVVEPDPVPLPVLRDVQEMPGKLDRGGPKVKEATGR